MKAKNQVCTIRRIQARKGHNIAKLIAAQHKDHLHFKQMEVWVSMRISISQGIFLMEEINTCFPNANTVFHDFQDTNTNVRAKEG